MVYQNYENGYAVLRVNVGGGQNVTVVGTIPLPAVGERLMVTGKWSTHSSYGRQFEAEFLERLMPQTSLEILNYLSSRIIKGIGPKTAARIVEHFGEQTLLVMEREPGVWPRFPAFQEKAKAMGEEFRLQVGMRQLMEFFCRASPPGGAGGAGVQAVRRQHCGASVRRPVLTHGRGGLTRPSGG